MNHALFLFLLGCHDTKTNGECAKWKQAKYCHDNLYRGWMHIHCRRTCGVCYSDISTHTLVTAFKVAMEIKHSKLLTESLPIMGSCTDDHLSFIVLIQVA